MRTTAVLLRADIERADARLTAGSIARDVIAWMTRFNFGEDVLPPKLRIGREEDWDAGKMMPAVQSFVSMGGRVEASVIADRLGLPDAPVGDDVQVLQAPAARTPENAPRSADKANRAAATAESGAPHFSRLLRPSHFDSGAGADANAARAAMEQRIAARIVAEIAARAGGLAAAARQSGGGTAPNWPAEIAAMLGEDWERHLSGLVQPVLAAVAEASDYDKAATAMTAALAAIDTAELERALSQGALVARAKALEGAPAIGTEAATSDETRAKLSEIAQRRSRRRGRFANEVGRLVRAAEEKRDQQDVHDLGPLERSNVEAVRRDLNLDLGGYRRTIRDDMLRHALKSHSPIDKELARGQLPLTTDYFDRFSALTAHPDYVARAPKPHMGHPTIEYSKTFDDVRLLYTEHVDERNALVSFVTMRAYPVGKKVRR